MSKHVEGRGEDGPSVLQPSSPSSLAPSPSRTVQGIPLPRTPHGQVNTPSLVLGKIKTENASTNITFIPTLLQLFYAVNLGRCRSFFMRFHYHTYTRVLELTLWLTHSCAGILLVSSSRSYDLARRGGEAFTPLP